MFNSPCCPYSRRCRRVSGNPVIRLLNALPEAPEVDAYANGTLIAFRLKYKEFTDYFTVQASSYSIRLYPPGDKSTPLLEKNISIPAGAMLTLAGAGHSDEPGLISVSDRRMPIASDKAYIKYVNLSPDAGSIELTLTNATRLFNAVGFRGVSNYAALDPGTYTVQARLAGTNTVILNVPNIKIMPERFYTIYAVGLKGGVPAFQMLITPDGNAAM